MAKWLLRFGKKNQKNLYYIEWIWIWLFWFTNHSVFHSKLDNLSLSLDPNVSAKREGSAYVGPLYHLVD